MFSQILEVTLPVFGIALVGYLYGRLNGSDMDSANRINMNLFVPALLFYVLSEKIPDSPEWQSVAWGAAIIVLGSGILAWPLAHLLKFQSRVLLPPMMFNNSGNLGLPLAALAFGNEMLPFAVVAFVVSTSLHFSLGIWLVSGRLDPMQLLKNPVFLSTLTGIAAHITDWHTPALLLPGLEMLSQVAIPLMLVALGVRLIHVDISHWKAGLAGAILCPATGIISAVAAILLLQPSEEMRKILLLFSILPPAVMNFLLAERFHRSSNEVASMVAFGNLASLAIIPFALVFIL
ncbi:MAG: AEC family transporter [Candidatus Thiodiazotropha sp. (ex Monitilora ramsayi)]|nr:AEC family transporter [Candidatus Thiodiazotropha sp. (ex Monitilora ramsayi)]